MRSISATLKTAQEGTSKTPYIRLVFSGGPDYTTRLLRLDHHEEAYNEYANIILRNDDLGVASLKGQSVDIGYGFVTGQGNEYSTAPRLWVKSQQFVSMEGMLVSVLNLEGSWAVLRETPLRVGDPPFYTTTYTATTVYDIIDAILTAAGLSLNALGTQDDGIINDYQPKFAVNEQLSMFEYANGLIYRLILMTKCYLRPKAGLAFEVIYPQASDGASETYYSDQAHYFYEYIEKVNVLVPNHIIVFCNEGADLSWSSIITGEAEDSAEQSGYMEVIELFTAGEITSQGDANNRAAAILTRYKSEMLGGRLLIPHDCSVELYDKVHIVDSRGY